MTERESRLRDAIAAYNAGDLALLEQLFTPTAVWHGVEGFGVDGETPT